MDINVRSNRNVKLPDGAEIEPPKRTADSNGCGGRGNRLAERASRYNDGGKLRGTAG